ncbi:MAG: DUF5618 family protein [bacterium]
MNEALRYLNNAKEILKNAPVEDNYYTDVKYVQEACGTAYLAILKAINEYLLNKGLSKKELPKSYESYTKALRKHLSMHNGKLFKQFDYLYDELHLAGYYRGDLHNVNMVKEALKSAKAFIEKIG